MRGRGSSYCPLQGGGTGNSHTATTMAEDTYTRGNVFPKIEMDVHTLARQTKKERKNLVKNIQASLAKYQDLLWQNDPNFENTEQPQQDFFDYRQIHENIQVLKDCIKILK